jgi:hypothetical protein
MKKTRIVAAAAAVVLTSVFATSVFAGNVTETKPECSEASAVLLAGVGNDTQAARIHQFIEVQRVWTDATVVSWDLTFPAKGGPTTVYGVKCKSGKGCNNLAHAFAEANQDSSPIAFCGPTIMLRGESQR